MSRIGAPTPKPTLQDANSRALSLLYRRLCAEFERMEKGSEFGQIAIVVHFQEGRAVNTAKVTTEMVDKL